ncbi:MAG TPA: hypothetical protein IAC50_04640, partial [Candidatus Copromorpha excrementigallinarum]|nr:hypothetical protein [Candidatus Copromorpha excrementigallinarum]
PDKLNDYIRVSNPAMWLLLAAIIALLLGACVWGIFGKLETKVEVAAQADENGAITCYVPAAVIESVSEGMDVEIGEDVFTISRIDGEPVSATQELGEYLLHTGGLKEGEWVYRVELDGSVPAGVYPAEIITEQISPMSFLTN